MCCVFALVFVIYIKKKRSDICPECWALIMNAPYGSRIQHSITQTHSEVEGVCRMEMSSESIWKTSFERIILIKVDPRSPKSLFLQFQDISVKSLFFVYCWCKCISRMVRYPSSGGTEEPLNVVLWYIYSCQSGPSWDSDKINSRDVASLPLTVSRSTYSSHASHPILFDTSPANTSCQSALKSQTDIYWKKLDCCH